MASEGPNSPGTLADDSSVGTEEWTDESNAAASDDAYAATALTGTATKDNSVRLVVGGSVTGDDKASGSFWPGSDPDSYVSYGSSSDDWSASLTPTNVNASDFGVAVSCKSAFSGPSVSYYLKATNFGFSIPAEATINGVVFELERWTAGGSGRDPRIDHMRLTVYYTVPDTSLYGINVGDDWKDINETLINVGDSWKKVTEKLINVGDVWKKVG